MNFVAASTDFFETRYYHNSVTVWITSISIFLFLVPFLVLLKRLLVRWLMSISQKTKTDIDDFLVALLSRTKFTFLLIAALSAASHFLELPPKPDRIFSSLFIVALWLQIAFWGTEIIHFLLLRLTERKQKDGSPDPSLKMTLNALQFLVRMIFFAVVFLLILDNLGFNVTTLIAGLGVSGIAVALAVQNILGDLFASLSIVLDKPFVLGDRIVVDKDEGYVQEIGLKTTRLQAVSGEQIICANADLLKSRIHNFKRMRERRVIFETKVRHETIPENLERIPKIIQEIISKHSMARFDRSHLKQIGDWAFVFETVYFVKSPDYRPYMEIENAINLEIVNKWRELSIAIAHNP